MKKEVKIEGMSCGHCVMHVKEALGELKGINNFEVEIGKAVIEGDINDESIKAAIDDAGYDVISITTL
ncbi:copper chaperone CopZ [Hypnocyclicus thermotrophus]|uniref:Copper chaperone CopZ n=1 Tax=Hypnocyclicus thermotrophus TaxID=1627895 RepID=A0AA46I6B4_9FUSO|nr:cation transporter [Hypnocyclicus thermotrophus]TDT72029.1 copper chaperone CopZ [Hypnocyclicus thermotrophus]